VGRVIKLPGGRRIAYDELTDEQRVQVDAWLNDVWLPLVERNPLEAFEAHSDAQEEFLRAETRTIVALAGNQFGKTTSLVVKALAQQVPKALLPERLHPFKRFDGAVQGRIVVPGHSLVEGNMLPAFRQWCPRAALKAGSFEKAWSSSKNTLSFADGGFIDFLTYETDLDKFGGVQRHYVAYDEPPPRHIRDEGLARIMRFGGFEMMAFTPVKANVGWLRRDIFKKRESPDITLVRGSIHDNQTLDPEARKYFLESLPSDLWRRAREFGDFVDVGGLIYESFDRAVVKEPWPIEQVQQWDTVVGIDPGIRNCGITWTGFDRDNVAHVFAERLIQDGTPADYQREIALENARWGLKDVAYVVDPAARQRNQTNAQTVMSMLAEHGIYAAPGQNDVEAGIQQIRERIQHDRFKVSPACVHLRDEADDYAAEETEDGSFKVIKGNDHVLDSLRYGCMTRPWFAALEAKAPERMLGWQPGHAPPSSQMQPQPAVGPMGFMS
jgi:phage terminase large subunit-like protein